MKTPASESAWGEPNRTGVSCAAEPAAQAAGARGPSAAPAARTAGGAARQTASPRPGSGGAARRSVVPERTMNVPPERTDERRAAAVERAGPPELYPLEGLLPNATV